MHQEVSVIPCKILSVWLYLLLAYLAHITPRIEEREGIQIANRQLSPCLFSTVLLQYHRLYLPFHIRFLIRLALLSRALLLLSLFLIAFFVRFPSQYRSHPLRFFDVVLEQYHRAT